MVAARERVGGNRQISPRVAPVSALMGFRARFPQALIQRWDLMSVRTRDLNPAEGEHPGDFGHSGRPCAVELADRNSVSFDETNNSGAVSLRRRIGYRAENPIDRDVVLDDSPLVESLQAASGERTGELLKEPPRNTVLKRYHDRVGMIESRQMTGHAGYLVGLEGQDHYVVGAERAKVIRCGQVGRRDYRSVRLDEFHAVGADGRQILASSEEADVLSGNRQAGAEQTSDRSRTDDANAHRASLGR